MIVTITLNPSLDRTLEIERLVRGSVLRTSSPTLEAGGKGVNVSRALAANGIPNLAVLPVGEPGVPRLSYSSTSTPSGFARLRRSSNPISRSRQVRETRSPRFWRQPTVGEQMSSLPPPRRA